MAQENDEEIRRCICRHFLHFNQLINDYRPVNWLSFWSIPDLASLLRRSHRCSLFRFWVVRVSSCRLVTCCGGSSPGPWLACTPAVSSLIRITPDGMVHVVNPHMDDMSHCDNCNAIVIVDHLVRMDPRGRLWETLSQIDGYQLLYYLDPRA